MPSTRIIFGIKVIYDKLRNIQLLDLLDQHILPQTSSQIFYLYTSQARAPLHPIQFVKLHVAPTIAVNMSYTDQLHENLQFKTILFVIIG